MAAESSAKTNSTFCELFEDVARAECAEFFTIVTKRLDVATVIASLSISTKGAVDVGLKEKKGRKEGGVGWKVKVIPTGSLRRNQLPNSSWL